MFNSIHSQRWAKWFLSPKNFEVNLIIKLPYNKHLFVTEKVVALTKREAVIRAKEKAIEGISVVYKGHKSLGKVKTFEEVI